MSSTVEDLQNEIVKFRDDRNWKQFHTPKDLAMSICIEASELLECFQWKSEADIKTYLKSEKAAEISEEMADVLIYLLNLADVLNVDVIRAATKKLEKNSAKYPIEKAKGNAKKYTELE